MSVAWGVVAALGLWRPTGDACTLPGGWQVRRVAEADEAWHGELRRGGQVLGRWPSTAYDASGRWCVATAPGAPVLVAERVATSNGIGVQTWRFTAIEPGHAPYQWESRDWGPDGVRVRAGALEVLITDWAHPRQGRHQASMHLLGAWARLTPTRLAPASPWRARRYTFRFERERDAGITDAGGRPAHWLRAGAPACAIVAPAGRRWAWPTGRWLLEGR